MAKVSDELLDMPAPHDTDTPRVEACIQDVMRRFPGYSVSAQARYYEEVHQHLSPLARALERELAAAGARIRELEQEAARYRWLKARVFAYRGRGGPASFGLHWPKPVNNPMFGSVAQHLDEAITAAMAASAKGGKE